MTIKLPPAISHMILHNEHRCSHMTVEEYVKFCDYDEDDLSPADLAECIRTEEIWEILWYPDTPVGFFRVVAPTLERALEMASGEGDKDV